MKITASKKDDILRRKAQYEEDYAAYEQRQAGYRRAYNEAESQVLDPIRQYLERKLGRYSALKFDIRVSRGWDFRSDHDETDGGAEVRIDCNEHRMSEEGVALAWSYNASIKGDGSIRRESSSWSGLNATTEEQMNSLRQTVSALEFLNDVDWDELLHVKLPRYSDYYDENDKRPQREDFETQLRDAELEELVGENKLIAVNNWGESCPFSSRKVWLRILKETPSMFFATVISDWTVESVRKGGNPSGLLGDLNNQWANFRVRKSSIHLYNPVEILDIDELTSGYQNPQEA